MKYLITISLALFLMALLSSPAAAIDKKQDPSPKKDTPTVEKKAPERPQSVNDSKVTSNKSRRKSYDDFVDRNNNGIDDRAEKGSTQKKSKTPETRKKTPTEKPKP
jgi:hypothetical protein